MLIGYARVSTNDQETATQVAALKAAGCERLIARRPQVDGASGANSTGYWTKSAMEMCSFVWKLDRLSRSLRDVLTIMERLAEAKAGLRSLTEAIDTTTPAGRMMMQTVGAFAEFERAMLREGTKAGLDAAPARRAHRRASAKVDASTAVRDQQDGFKRSKHGSRGSPPVHPATVSRLLVRTGWMGIRGAK